MDYDKKYDLYEMVKGDVILTNTGDTDGANVKGVSFEGSQVWTDTMVLRAPSGTVRWVKTCHSNPDKFNKG